MSMGGRGSPVKREHPDLDSDSPLPKIMRTMAQNALNQNVSQSPKPNLFDPTRALSASPRSENPTPRSRTPPTQLPPALASSPTQIVTPGGNTPCKNQNSRSPVNPSSTAAAAALGRLFPGVSTNMNAKVNVNGTSHYIES